MNDAASKPATGARANANSVADDAQHAPEPGFSRSADVRTLKRSVLALLIVLGMGACYLAQEILIPVALALLLSLLLSSVVTLLERALWLPRFIGSLLTVAAVVAVLVLALMSLAQPAQKWIAHAPETLRTIEQRLHSLRAPIQKAQEASKQIEELTHPAAVPKTVISTQRNLIVDMATSTPRALGEIAAVLLLMYFFLSSGNGFLRRMVEITPALHEKKLIVSIARAVQQEMSRYLATVSAINIGLGTATAIAMALLDVPNPMLWGAVVAVFNFAPYVGPACALLALTLVGFTTFDTLGHALAVPGSFLLFATIEGQLITPTIIGRRLALDPSAVFVWLLMWGWLWGIVGILLAGPLLVCFRIVCKHVQVLHAVGILIGDGSASGSIRKSGLG